jgi:hypothetical protein
MLIIDNYYDHLRIESHVILSCEDFFFTKGGLRVCLTKRT